MTDITKTERITTFLQNAGDILGSDSSVELSQTSKGIPTWKIKVYNSDPEIALQTANKLFDKCQKKYGQVS